MKLVIVPDFRHQEPAKRPSYQTVKLNEYRLDLRQRADLYYRRFRDIIGTYIQRVDSDGSYTMRGRNSDKTIAKLLIVEEGRGKRCNWAESMEEGVHLLVRTDSEVRWLPDTKKFFDWSDTIGVAPMHDVPFAHYLLSSTGDETEAVNTVLRFVQHN